LTELISLLLFDFELIGETTVAAVVATAAVESKSFQRLLLFWGNKLSIIK